MSDFEDVFIADKPIKNYITAGVWALGQNKPVRILARGTNIKMAVDVAEILKRQMIDPKVFVEIDSEEFNDRKVSSISIVLEGKKKIKE